MLRDDSLDHIGKSGHNENFLNFVQSSDPNKGYTFPDWMITVAFYIAVHKVDAKLSKMGDHPSDHFYRNTLVANKLPTISSDYFFLKNKSEFARYSPKSHKQISQRMVDRCIRISLKTI